MSRLLADMCPYSSYALQHVCCTPCHQCGSTLEVAVCRTMLLLQHRILLHTAMFLLFAWLMVIIHAQSKLDLEASDAAGRTPLHIAASGGHSGVVKRLISKGALCDAPAHDGTTALWAAAYAGQDRWGACM